MGLGLLLIPALGGYWFLTRCYLTRYSALRDTGYHLFFRATTTGGVLLIVAYVLVALLNWQLPCVGKLWKSFVPFDHFGTFVGSALLGYVLPIVVNLFYGKEQAARRTATDSGDLIELLIAESLERQHLVEISLRSGKSYIGFAIENGITRRGEPDVALIPMASGYRDKDTHKLNVTTNYAPVIQECLAGDQAITELFDQDFRVVFPMSDIASARLFHPDVYKRFQQHRPAGGSAAHSA